MIKEKYFGPVILLAVFGLSGVLGLFSQADIRPINVGPIKDFFVRAEPVESPGVKLMALINELTSASGRVLETSVELDQATREAAMLAEQEAAVFKEKEAAERAAALVRQKEADQKAELARLAAAENKKKPAAPVSPAPISTPSVSVAATASTLAPREIAAKSVVALICHYTTKNAILTDAFAYRGELLSSGTGVVIHPDGYILVARHIVDPLWVNRAQGEKLKSPERTLNENREFNYCEVGFIRNNQLPTRQEVVEFNYRAEVKNPFPYIATRFFTPTDVGMSADEINSLDFAVLKITRPWDECQYFNACDLPQVYDYALISGAMPALQQELSSYGFQDQSSYYFNDLVLQGAVGGLVEEYHGRQYFAGQKLGFSWHISRGLGADRIGSPVFWNGYLVGLNYAVDESDQRKANAVSMAAVIATLKNNGLAHIFSTP